MPGAPAVQRDGRAVAFALVRSVARAIAGHARHRRRRVWPAPIQAVARIIFDLQLTCALASVLMGIVTVASFVTAADVLSDAPKRTGDKRSRVAAPRSRARASP